MGHIPNAEQVNQRTNTRYDQNHQNRQLINDKSVMVVSKADVLHAPVTDTALFPLSIKTGAGLPEFLAHITTRVADMLADRGAPTLTRERHRAALEDCLKVLCSALQPKAPELLAEDLRLAMRALGRITGRVDVEDLLDVIFRDFCIGK